MAQPDNRIASLLSATLSPVLDDRRHAENALADLELLPGVLTALFQISISSTSPVSQAASVYLKNLVRREWEQIRPHPTSPTSLLHPPDKAYLKHHIQEALVCADSKLRSQLAETLKRIISADYPARYPSFLPELMRNLQSSQAPRVEAALIALRCLAKVYEFKGAARATRSPVVPLSSHTSNLFHDDAAHLDDANDSRDALNHVVATTFPQLLHIIKSLETTIAEYQATPPFIAPDKPYEVQRTICKIFWSCTQYDLPSLLLSDLTGVFSEWMSVFLSAMNRPVIAAPPTTTPPEEDDLRRMPQWKVKQWIGHIVYRLFQRYSNPTRFNAAVPVLRSVDLQSLTAFADFFRRTFAAPFTLAMLNVLDWDRTLTSPRVANLALLYLESAVSPSITFKVIKPRIPHLLTNIIFPYLCLTDTDLALWQEEPVEYVRKTYDVLEDFNTPRAAACSLLFMMSKLRRSVVVSPFLAFLSQILNAYSAVSADALSPQRANLARQKDGALLAIGTIRDAFSSTPQNSEQLQLLLSTHVLSEFDSDIPFLRARACWIYGHLTAAGSIPIEAVLPGLRGVQKCLTDKEFPVRVRAAVDIRHFLQNKVTADLIAPNLAELLTLLFTLLDDIDNTDIVATIDQVVVGFSDQIAPFAAPLCARLVDTFSRAASAGQDDDEAGFAAAQCIQALESIITSVALSCIPDKVTVIADIERTVSEVFDHMFEEDRIEYFEESLELVATFVYHSSEERGAHLRASMAANVAPHSALLGHPDPSKPGVSDFSLCSAELKSEIQSDVAAGGGVISPYLWSLFPNAMYAFHEWASDYSFHYLHLVDSYLSKSPRVFISNCDGDTSYVQLLLGMISRLWDDSSLDEDDFAVQGSRICGLFLRHCHAVERASIESEVAVLTQLAVLRLRANSGSQRAVTSLLRSLAHLIYVSTVTALSVIDSSLGCTAEVFRLWMSMVQHGRLEGVYDRKASAIALSSILGSEWELLPVPLQPAIPQLLVTVVSLLESLASGERKRQKFVDQHGADGMNGKGCVSTDQLCVGDEDGDVDPSLALSHDAETQKLVEAAGAELKRSQREHGAEDMGGDGDCTDANAIDEEEHNDSTDEGENPMFGILHDVDELLFFEGVVSRLSPVASQNLTMALAADDTKRIQCALHRAAESRTIHLKGIGST